MIAPSPARVACFHCGDPCPTDPVRAAGHEFCCTGCKAVYELLQESGLCTYYDLERAPGVKEAESAEEVRSDLFDLPEVRDRLVEFSEDGITRVRLHVPQMHCSSCIWLLENLHRIEPAILRSRVRFGEKELTVNFREDRLSLRRLVELLRRIGYAPRTKALAAGARKEDTVPRALYVKLAVAGFCFGNTMLFSFPEYLGADVNDAVLLRGFQFMNVLFSLPVVFYCSTDFFTSAWAGLRGRRINIDQPIALGIVALFARSLADVLTATGPGYFDSLAGLLFFLLIGRWYQAFTYKALSFDRSIHDLLPLAVLRKQGDREEVAAVADLRTGDRIVVRDQELVPVDAVLREGRGSIDNSFITGEPLPVTKEPGDTIRAGGRQRGAAIEVEVLRPFEQSSLKRMWEEFRKNDAERPLMPRTIDGVARRFTLAVLLIALGTGLYWWGRDAAQVWPVVTAVLIVACPCALALSMPFAYGHTIRLLGRKGLFLRDAEVVERLSRVDTVVFDKTGTLTAREAWSVRSTGMELDAVETRLVRSLARNSTHPLSAALYRTLSGEVRAADAVAEHAGQGISGTVDGTPVRMGSAAYCGGSPVEVAQGEAQVHVTIAGVHRGAYLLRKQTRNGMDTAVRAIGGRATACLLTGDATVDAGVAAMFAPDRVRVNCTPEDKARYVKALQAEGRRVLMVGDGLNDAGALAQSDVGITVSESSAAFTPASDAILDARSLEDLPRMMRLARRAHRIVLASLGVSLVYNLTGVSFAVSGHMTPLLAAILMPLSSVSVVGFVSLAVWLAARGTDRRNS